MVAANSKIIKVSVRGKFYSAASSSSEDKGGIKVTVCAKVQLTEAPRVAVLTGSMHTAFGPLGLAQIEAAACSRSVAGLMWKR